MAEDNPAGSSPEEQVALDEVEARLAGKEPPKKEEPKAKVVVRDQRVTVEQPDEELEEILAQADKPDAVKNAIQRHQQKAQEARERADAAEARVKEFEDMTKSEQQKQQEKAEADAKRADAAEVRALRLEVAAANGLDLKLAGRLQGNNQQELEEDASRLLELVKPNTPSGDPDAGKGAAEQKEENFSTVLRKQAGLA